MPQPNKITSHEEVAIDLTPTQFKEKVNYLAFLKTYTDSIQELENVFYDDLFIKHLYNNLEGVALDKLGELFGLRRTVGETDNELRREIVGEVMKRASDGTPDRIREILEALLPITDTRVIEHFPQALMVYGEAAGDTFTLRGEEAQYLKDASPVCTGSTVFGYVRDISTLFIPSELSFNLRNKVARAPAPNDDDLTPLFEWNIVTPDAGTGLDNIVVRVDEEDLTITRGTDPEAIHGILPEIGIRQERFRVDLTDGTQDDFSIDSANGTEQPFFIETAGIENHQGILLETTQRSITTTIETIGTYP